MGDRKDPPIPDGSETRCSNCYRPLDFGTDGNGHLTVSHPVGPCVRPVHKVTRIPPPCEICGADIPIERPGPYRRTCKPECAEILAARDKEREKWKKIAEAQDRALALRRERKKRK